MFPSHHTELKSIGDSDRWNGSVLESFSMFYELCFPSTITCLRVCETLFAGLGIVVVLLDIARVLASLIKIT